MRTTADRGGWATPISWSRIAFYWGIKTAAWPVTRFYVRMRVIGPDHVPRRGRCIVVANHTSYADAVVLGSACPRRLNFLITEPIYRLLRLRWFYYMMGAIPLAPEGADTGALRRALRVLGREGAIGIFPEGQRVAEGDVAAGRGGVGLLAARTGAPVVPAAIVGAREVMPIGSAFPRPHALRVIFGEPMRFPAWEGRRHPRDAIRDFSTQVMDAVADLMRRSGPIPQGRDRVRTTGA